MPSCTSPCAVSAYLGSKSHASARQLSIVGLRGHHAELAPVDEVGQVIDLLLQRRVLDVLCGVWVGWLVAGVGVAERHLCVCI